MNLLRTLPRIIVNAIHFVKFGGPAGINCLPRGNRDSDSIYLQVVYIHKINVLALR